MLLQGERPLAFARRDHLPRFFIGLRFFLREFTAGQARATLRQLYWTARRS
jgi:hypothetical protein